MGSSSSSFFDGSKEYIYIDPNKYSLIWRSNIGQTLQHDAQAAFLTYGEESTTAFLIASSVICVIIYTHHRSAVSAEKKVKRKHIR